MKKFLVFLSLVCLSLGISFLAHTDVQADANYGVSLSQEKNSPTLDVKVDDPTSLAGVADTVKVELKMSYNGVTTQDISSSAENISQSFQLGTNVFGAFQATLTFYLSGNLVHTQQTTVDVIADEYNVADLSGTFSPTMFSLAMFGKNSLLKNAVGDTIPTVTLLERPNMWNWNSLPEGVYGLPFITKDQLTYQDPSFTAASQNYARSLNAMSAYVKSLYEISPNAKFHFYTVDYFLSTIFSQIYANQIPASNYDVHILSDGSFSYNRIATVYTGTSQAANETIQKQMIDEWNSAEAEAYQTGQVPSGFTWSAPNKYVYAALNADPNILQWWVASKSMVKTPSDASDTNASGDYAANVIQKDPKVYAFGIAAYLKTLSSEDTSAFKALLNFGDTFFGKSEQDGKKIMMFIGAPINVVEKDTFPDYARLMMEQYGSDYDYYYKGHPGTPTAYWPSKQNEEVNLGIDDVDSNIPAELILFFNPNITICGYPSSVFTSAAELSSELKSVGLFGLDKATALSTTGILDYAKTMDLIISPISSTTNQKVQNLADEGQRAYEVELTDTGQATRNWNLAIWEPDIDVTKYYTSSNGDYTLLKTDKGNLNSSYLTKNPLGIMTGYTGEGKILSGKHVINGITYVFSSAGSLISTSVYRLYNPNTGEHFYTTSAGEKASILKVGWKDEGIGWTAPTSGSPIYRVYNPNAKGGDHYYTKSKYEATSLVKSGWKWDNGGQPVFYSGGSAKIYVAYNPNAKSGAHNYTISSFEQNSLLKTGWKFGAVAWNAQ